MVSVHPLNSSSPLEHSEIKNVNQEKSWLGKKWTYIGQQAFHLASSLIRKIRNLSLPLLKWSILNRYTSLAKVFTAIVVDVNDHPENELSCLQFACSRNLKEVVQALLKKGAKANEECVLGPCHYTPLFWAVDGKYSEIIDLLHQHGADVNKLCDNKSLLMRTLEANNLETAQHLIDLGADPNLGEKRSDSTSHSPLSECIEKSYRLSEEEQVKQVEWLLSQKANPNMGYETILQKKDLSGQTSQESLIRRTPLHSLIKNAKISYENYFALFKLLLENGADPNKGYIHISSKESDTFYCTPLQEVITWSYLSNKQKKQIIELLFQHKAQADYNSGTNDHAPGYSLFLAIKENNVELVKLLLEKGVDAKTCGHYLLWQAENKDAQFTKLLKTYGAKDNGKHEPSYWSWPHIEDMKYE